MEIVLKGFDDWVIDTAHTNKGRRWVDIYRKKGPKNWEKFRAFDDLGSALDCMIKEGMGMTEDQICEVQESCYQGNTQLIQETQMKKSRAVYAFV